MTTTTIRVAGSDDLDEVVQLAARAWAPVFAAVNAALGANLALLIVFVEAATVGLGSAGGHR